MKILGIDFETTGLDPQQDRIVEVGAVLWDWPTSTPLCLLSTLVRPGRPIPPEVTQIHGITDELVNDYGQDEAQVFADLAYLLERSDYAMAHNGTTFDKLFYDAAVVRTGEGCEKLWLDTKTDIKYPEQITTRKLRHLAAEHEFLNPFSHRAVFDVLTMLRVASCYPIEDIIARASEATLYVQALVSYDERDKAKARGYYWCGPRKLWWRTFKASEYAAEKDTCGFRTSLLPGSPE